MATPEQKTEHLSLTSLFTAGNPFTKAPDGSAEIADNVIFREPGMAEPRRGFSKSVANIGGTIKRVFPWNGAILTHAADGQIRPYTDAGGFSTSFINVSQPDASNPVRFCTANKSLFFTSSTGVKVMSLARRKGARAGTGKWL